MRTYVRVLIEQRKRTVTTPIFSPQFCHPFTFSHFKRVTVDERKHSE